MGGALPSPIALARFYQVFAVVAIITTGVIAIAVRRRMGRRTLQPLGRRWYSRAYRGLAKGIGALWVMDGLLQAQPLLNTHFISALLAPQVQGQPAPLAFAIKLGIRVWSLDPVAWNEITVWIQIAIGLMILLGGSSSWRRIGLWLSLGWGLMVWIAGEAMGSLFVKGSWLTAGSPGSVLIYMLIAILLLLPSDNWDEQALRRLRWGLAALWGLSALLQLWPTSGWWGKSLSHSVLSMAQTPQPTILSAPLYAWARLLQSHPVGWNAILVVSFGILGLLWLVWPKSRLTWGLTTLATFLTWWFGQDFGVLGGMGTDPNSGAVLLWVLFGYARLTPQASWTWFKSRRSARNPIRSHAS